mgnify:CR=1 FL=1|tara:strand:+ start:2626 stop:3093 length:468 start_codon:yes stop_codon:yes gene_type:complete
MVQYYQNDFVGAGQWIRADLYNFMTDSGKTNLYKPLIVFKSHFTKGEKVCLPWAVYNNAKERYIALSLFIQILGSTEDLSAGEVLFGTRNFPYGFYDVTVYENKDNTNLVVADAVKKLFTGLMHIQQRNLVGDNNLEYTEYTTNDSDTESVYLTN